MDKKIRYRYILSATRLLPVIILLLCSCVVCAQMPTEFTINPNITDIEKPEVEKTKKQKQEKTKETKKEDTPTTEGSVKKSGKQTLIYLERSDLVRFDNENLPDIQVLVGNVVLRHDDVFLYCDSAHMNQQTNSFKAFGHVKIEQGDSLEIYSKRLNYDGNTKIGHLFHDVKMINGEVTLYTDTLIYNRNRNLGYYKCGGKLVDSLNTLVSKHGYYYSDTKLAEFRYNVVGINNSSTIESDTLTYNTESKISTILGPTYIHHSDSTIIYSELGWYNSESDKSQLLKNSLINHGKGKSLAGDTIFYDKKIGIGEAFQNVILSDTLNKINLYGHYGYYKEEGEIGIITDSALMVEYSQVDTTYIHGDTLYSYAQGEDEKMTLAYRNVRLYHNDFQGVCDSLTFYSGDSILHLMQMPIIWSDDQQITGDTIHIYPKDGSVEKMHVINNAMMIQEEDTVHYNQVSGKEIISYIKDGELEHVDISGNVESIFYPNDEEGLIGLNTIKSSYMAVYFKEGKLERFNVFPSPTAIMYPMSQIKENMLYLPNYTWQIEARPISKDDIFRQPKRLTQADVDAQKQELKAKEQEERKNKRKKKNQESEELELNNDELTQ
jgi:lipopolysaccharide export system protein LptA